MKRQIISLISLFNRKSSPIVLAPIEITTRDAFWKVRLFAEVDSLPILIIGRYEIINSLLKLSSKCFYIGKNIIQHGASLSKKRTRELVEICNRNSQNIIYR